MKKLDTCEGKGDKIDMYLIYVKNANNNTNTHILDRCRGRRLVVDKVTCSYSNSQVGKCLRH
jgi:hypothetical protein